MKKILYIFIALVALFALVGCDTALHTPAATGGRSVTTVTIFHPTEAYLHGWGEGFGTDWPGVEMKEVWYIVIDSPFGGCKFSEPESGNLDGIGAPGVYLYDGDAGWKKIADASKVIVMSDTEFESFYTWEAEELGGWPGSTNVKHAFYATFEGALDGTIFTDGVDTKLYGEDNLPGVSGGVWTFDTDSKKYVEVN